MRAKMGSKDFRSNIGFKGAGAGHEAVKDHGGNFRLCALVVDCGQGEG